MARLICFKEEDWNHLVKKLNFRDSALDADAIRTLNEPIIREE